MSNYIIDYLLAASPARFVKFAAEDKKDSLEDLEEQYQDALLEREMSLKALAPSDSWFKRKFYDPYFDKVPDKELYKKLVNIDAAQSEQENQKAIDTLIGLKNPESLRLARALTNIARLDAMKRGKKFRPLLPMPSRMEDPALLQYTALNRRRKDMSMHAGLPRFTFLLNH